MEGACPTPEPSVLACDRGGGDGGDAGADAGCCILRAGECRDVRPMAHLGEGYRQLYEPVDLLL